MMCAYPLHQTEPTFHGDRMRLGYREAGNSAIVSLVPEIADQYNGVAMVFLPEDQREALRAACEAFNAVMDHHEALVPPVDAYPEKVGA